MKRYLLALIMLGTVPAHAQTITQTLAMDFPNESVAAVQADLYGVSLNKATAVPVKLACPPSTPTLTCTTPLPWVVKNLDVLVVVRYQLGTGLVALSDPYVYRPGTPPNPPVTLSVTTVVTFP